MGKLQSKHVCRRQGPEGECILVNTQFGSSSLDKLSDFDKVSADSRWPDFSFDQSVWQKVLNNQEVSVCLRSMSPNRQTTTAARPATRPQLPLTVVLPPEKVVENKSACLLTMDQNCNKKMNDSETTDDNNKTLNVEEFECGVSVAGSDKQEWSFTLYDFDGKGKITKEDLGSLLRSLYDAVGSSINLPKSGTKTLKLRLTVSPDNSKVTGSAGATLGSGSAPTHQSKDKNATKETNKTKESKLNKDLDNSKLSGKDLKLDNISKAEQLNLEASSEPKVHHKEVKNNLSNPGKPQMQSQCVGTEGGVVLGADGKPTPGKPQLSSTEQRHLAELVQRNMERHQQRQQQRYQHRARRDHRKHHSFSTETGNCPTGVVLPHTCEESRDRRNYYLDLAGIENDEPSHLHNMSAPADLLSPRLGKRDHGHRARDAKLRSRSHNARRQLQAQAQKKAAAVEEGTLNSSSVAAVVDGGDVTDMTGVASHQRSRSYDVPQEPCKLPLDEELAAEVTSHRTWLMERAVEEKVEKAKNITSTTTTTTASLATTSPQSPPPVTLTSPQSVSTPNSKNVHKLRPVSLPPNVPDTVSPHHHRRHRNRERNRKLAMQQVAEWIEREHVWNSATRNGGGPGAVPGDRAQAHGTGGATRGGNAGPAGMGAEHVIVQRHEHHHVHEHHHHHHYHHYHET